MPNVTPSPIPAVNAPPSASSRERDRARALGDRTDRRARGGAHPAGAGCLGDRRDQPSDRSRRADRYGVDRDLDVDLHGDHHRGRGPADRRRAASGGDGIGGGAMVGRRRIRGRRRRGARRRPPTSLAATAIRRLGAISITSCSASGCRCPRRSATICATSVATPPRRSKPPCATGGPARPTVRSPPGWSPTPSRPGPTLRASWSAETSGSRAFATRSPTAAGRSAW